MYCYLPQVDFPWSSLAHCRKSVDIAWYFTDFTDVAASFLRNCCGR